MIISQELEPYEVYNHIRDVFSSMYEWDAALQEICEREGTIQELLDVSSPVFNNMLVVTDKDSKILAGSYEGYHCTSGKYVDVVNSDMTPKILSSVIKHVTPTVFYTDLGEYMDLEEGASYVILVKRIKDPLNHVDVAFVIRPDNRPVGNHDYWMVEQLTQYIKKILQRSPQVEELAGTDVFDALLNGDNEKVERIGRLYQACDFRDGDCLRCMVIERPQYITEVDLGYFGQRLRAVMPNATFTVFDNCFVILINETRSEWDKRCLREWVSSWLGGRKEPIGISNRFENLTDLKMHYCEASAALCFTGRDPDSIMIFSECQMDYALSHCAGDFEKTRLFPPGLNRLLVLDRSLTVDYISTLRIWLDEGMNDSKAAKKLQISRNSFLYRKDRILDALQMDIQDSEIRFFLSLCLRLLEL